MNKSLMILAALVGLTACGIKGDPLPVTQEVQFDAP